MHCLSRPTDACYCLKTLHYNHKEFKSLTVRQRVDTFYPLDKTQSSRQNMWENLYIHVCSPMIYEKSKSASITRRASRGHEAARSEKLLRLLSDRAQTLHNDRTFYSKQSYRFCFFILTVFGGEMTSRCKRQIFNCLLWHKKYMILKELIEIK